MVQLVFKLSSSRKKNSPAVLSMKKNHNSRKFIIKSTQLLMLFLGTQVLSIGSTIARTRFLGSFYEHNKIKQQSLNPTYSQINWARMVLLSQLLNFYLFRLNEIPSLNLKLFKLEEFHTTNNLNQKQLRFSVNQVDFYIKCHFYVALNGFFRF